MSYWKDDSVWTTVVECIETMGEGREWRRRRTITKEDLLFNLGESYFVWDVLEGDLTSGWVGDIFLHRKEFI